MAVSIINSEAIHMQRKAATRAKWARDSVENGHWAHLVAACVDQENSAACYRAARKLIGLEV